MKPTQSQKNGGRSTMKALSRCATVAVTAAALAVAGLACAPAQAQTGPSYSGGNCPAGLTCTHWCPGDPVPPGSQVVSWDWNVCHDWYWNSEGIVDVVSNTMYPWHGTPHPAAPPPVLNGTPPPPAPRAPVFCSPRGALIIIPPICDEIGY
jgi:hypothetical protein